ncbi:MAG: fibrillarin-like rRNA/tRNA 2'-O-methyltransferase [Promethearchaeota archaeon]|nr:MAG: fibrillarin-like rRNA/tRNA 2'-O-methyltransferase [Candidatus Lokiarchaeota archaeon]
MSYVKLRNHPKFPQIYISGPSNRFKLYTPNLVTGKKVYGERIVKFKDDEYRRWDPYRSKLAALLLKDPDTSFLERNKDWLYLGASSGTTVSHVSDVYPNNLIYAVEFAERSMRELLQNTSKRTNVLPILGDARYPETYAKSIFTKVDLIYQDVAQPNQAEIAIANSDYYLNKGGFIIIAIKSQSIDSVSKVEDVYRNEKIQLEKGGYDILESINIHDYAANHIILIAQKK